MSCLSCHLCNWTLSSETKSELIIYPSVNPKCATSLGDYTFKIRTSKREGSHTVRMEEKNVVKEKENPAETIDTVSKIVSVPSHQILDQISSASILSMRQNSIHWAQSQIIYGLDNKQNAHQNYQLESMRQLESKRRVNSPKMTRRSNLGEQKPKSGKPDGMSNRLGNLNRQSLYSSRADEKNLSMILYEKENEQLRSQLSRLKEKQNELVAEQHRIRQKNNRELGHLKKRSQDLEARSSMRKKELSELKNILKFVDKNWQHES